MALDSDEPTIENLQVSLLLSIAYFQAGRGKKSYMLLCKYLHNENDYIIRDKDC